jgi:hypothetical protein
MQRPGVEIDENIDGCARSLAFAEGIRAVFAPRRVIARKPLCASVIARPGVARVNEIAACSKRRLDVGIFAARPRNRLPSAKSAR